MRDDYLASDAERELVAMRLRDGAAEGRLDPTEFEQRLEAAYAARTESQLVALVADLPPQTARMRMALSRVRRPALPMRMAGRVAAWAATSAALVGVWAGLAGARALTN